MYDSFTLRLDRGGLTKLSFPTEMHNSTPFLIPFALVPLALAVQSACAAESDDGYTLLDTSVVSAAGYVQDVRDAPATVSVISGEDLEKTPFSDLGEAVQDVPGVEVEQTKMGGHTIRIRGFESKYTLILIDGKRQNPDDGFVKNGFDPMGNFLPPAAAIERIEVLRGPASTIYGSDAVGGVVNIITKKNPDKFTGSITTEGTLQEHSDLYGNSWATSTYLAIPLVEDRLSLTLRGRYFQRSANGLRTPGGSYASHSPSEGFTGTMGGKLNFTLDEANNFYVDGDFHRFKGGAMSSSAAGTKSLWWANRTNVVVGHEGSYDFGTTDTYFQYGNVEHTGDAVLESTSYIFNTKLVTPMDFGDYGSMVLSSGLEYWYSTFRDDTEGKNLYRGDPPAGSENPFIQTDLVGNKLDQTQISGFLEGEYFFNERWSTTVGARLTWGDIFGAHVTPRAYLVYKPNDVLSFKGGIAGGYKVPSVKELTDGIYEVNGGKVNNVPRFGNPSLEPEESWNYELSGTLAWPALGSVTLTGFFTDFDNKIDYEDTTWNLAGVDKDIAIQRRINIGKVESKGVELLFSSAVFHGFSLSGSYTYTKSEIKSGADKGKPLSSLPEHVISAKLNYENGNFGSFLRVRAKMDMPNTGGKGVPDSTKHPYYNDYVVADLGVNYRFNKHHRVALTVNNLFDKEFYDWAETTGKGGTVSYNNLYRDYLEGRNFWFSYTYDF